MKDNKLPDAWEIDLPDWKLPELEDWPKVEDWPPLKELEDWPPVSKWSSQCTGLFPQRQNCGNRIKRQDTAANRRGR